MFAPGMATIPSELLASNLESYISILAATCKSGESTDRDLILLLLISVFPPIEYIPELSCSLVSTVVLLRIAFPPSLIIPTEYSLSVIIVELSIEHSELLFK